MLDTDWPRRWALLRQSILTAFPSAAEDGPAAIRLVLVATGTSRRRVGLCVRTTTAYGEPVLVISTDLDATMVLDARQALAVNGVLVHGALAVVNDTLEFRAIHAMDIEPSRLHLAIRKLAAEAAELQLRAPRTPLGAARAAAVGYLAD
jgi:hypothetical protein